MKTKITRRVTEEVDIAKIRFVIPNISDEYKHDGIHAGVHGITPDDDWDITIDIDTGKIDGWPIGKAESICIQPRDAGSYYLIDRSGNVIAKLEEDYVPSISFGHPDIGGDYIEMDVDEDGQIQQWPKKIVVSSFFRQDED